LIAPDHKALFLRLQIDNSIKLGPGTWKFNNLLLGNNDYRLLVNELLPIILEKYKYVESKQLLWELIKMEIGSETIKYSKAKRKKLNNRENLLQQEIEALDDEICNNVDLNQQLLNEHEAAKNELKESYDCKGREAIFRSKVRWVEKGEKPTRYFYNLEKRNYERKNITQLKTRNGEITSNKEQIRTELDDFYSDLLKTKFPPNEYTDLNDKFNDFLDGLEIPRLTEDEQLSLECETTLEELESVLKTFQNNKSPGKDGFTKEFYGSFFGILGNHLLNSYNEAFLRGDLSVSQRRGIISLIPKDDACLTEISNWRPITLLNVDYKIIAKVIGRRIEQILHKVIRPDQTGFIKGRYIGNNVRLLNDLMEYTDANRLLRIFLFIDFKKAFDNIEWSFIHNSLTLFNFGPVIRRWVYIFYNNVERGVMNCGYMTKYFSVSPGVRQGCSLSPLLFVLAVEVLALKIRQDKLCWGIKLPHNQEAKLSQFADDATLIVRDLDSLQKAIEIVSIFGSISGLELNKKENQSNVVWFSKK